MFLAACLLLLACKQPAKPASTEERAPDGGTLLEIDADCPEVAVDDAPWTAPKGTPVPVKPGKHRVRCGDKATEVEVHDGMLFHFWGLGY